MLNPTISAKIFATLGNNSSLIPLGIKDIGTITGMTMGSYITGKKVEGKDRFIDELGTSVIWLGGIPISKKLIDKTIYKVAKLNPNIDIRILENKEIFKKAKEYVIPELKASFEKVEKNKKLFKNLFYTKFAVSTVITLAAYFGLTMFRQKHTEKALLKEIHEENKQKEIKENKQSKNPSFGMNMSFINQFLFDPVKNTMIIDGGITTQRLMESRNPQDFLGYVIREGGFLVSMYVVDKAIRNHLAKKAIESHKPIDLDIKVLQDEYFKKSFKNKTIEKHLSDFPINGTDVQIYESLFNKSDNLVVQMAKKSGIIKTIKNSDKIDAQSFIDINAIKSIKEKIEVLYKEANANPKKGIDEFFKDVLKLKKASILKSIGVSMSLLGLVIPGTIVLSRLLKEDNKEFRVKKELKEKIKRNSLVA